MLGARETRGVVLAPLGSTLPTHCLYDTSPLSFRNVFEPPRLIVVFFSRRTFSSGFVVVLVALASHHPPPLFLLFVLNECSLNLTVSELYGEEDGTVQATFQVVYMIGWAPHDSQPQPKRRGSGQVQVNSRMRLLRKLRVLELWDCPPVCCRSRTIVVFTVGFVCTVHRLYFLIHAVVIHGLFVFSSMIPMSEPALYAPCRMVHKIGIYCYVVVYVVHTLT